jgi:tRNA pseudouridine38-40 synthase
MTTVLSTDESSRMRRMALGLQYDGSGFSGWQVQREQVTIQQLVEQAIRDFIADPTSNHPRVTAAGRTDTGVHALGQVVHFDTSVNRPDWSWVRGLNNFLPASISVQWAQEVSPEFDARFSAYERSYVYLLILSPVKTPLLHLKAGFQMLPPGKSLLIQEMRQAAQYLLGQHDFSCFRSSECQSKTPIKTLYQLEIIQDGAKVFFFLRANAFLHHMVRNIVGSLLQLRLGKQSAHWMMDLLERKDRTLSAPTFSANGLYLVQVGYPEHFQIPLPRFSDCAISEDFLNLAFRKKTEERSK